MFLFFAHFSEVKPSYEGPVWFGITPLLLMKSRSNISDRFSDGKHSNSPLVLLLCFDV